MKKIIHGEGSPSLQTEYGYLTRVVNNPEQAPDPKKEILIKEVEVEKVIERIVEVPRDVVKEVFVEIEKIVEVPKEVIVEKIVDKIVEVEKRVVVEKPVVEVITVDKPVEKIVEIEKKVLVTKIPSWARILLFGETLLIILGVIKCLK